MLISFHIDCKTVNLIPATWSHGTYLQTSACILWLTLPWHLVTDMWVQVHMSLTERKCNVSKRIPTVQTDICGMQIHCVSLQLQHQLSHVRILTPADYAGSSDRLTVSHSHSRHVRFLSPSRPLRFQQQATSSRLQPISIGFLFPSQHHHSRLNHFRIYFLDNKIEKTIV
jgi:hypothetical protein